MANIAVEWDGIGDPDVVTTSFPDAVLYNKIATREFKPAGHQSEKLNGRLVAKSITEWWCRLAWIEKETFR